MCARAQEGEEGDGDGDGDGGEGETEARRQVLKTEATGLLRDERETRLPLSIVSLLFP